MQNTKTFNSANSGFTLDLPDWAIDNLNALPTHFPTNDERMAAVIEFSRFNFQRKTGGPFAAGIFERDSGKLVVIGVNRVLPFHCSSAHAEVIAISLAQKLLGVSLPYMYSDLIRSEAKIDIKRLALLQNISEPICS